MLHLKFKNKLVVGVAAALIVLCGVGVFSYRLMLEENTDEAWVNHTDRVIATLDSLLTNLIDAETGERGFLLTGNSSYLQPYNSALARLQSEIDATRKLTADDPNQQSRLDRMTPLIASKLSELRKAISLRQDQGLAASLAVMQTGEGKHRMDQIRALIAQMKHAEEVLLEQRLARDTGATSNAKLLILGGYLFSFFLLFAAGMLVHQQMDKRARAEVELRMRQLEKFEALGKLAGGVAHDFNNVITAIMGWAELGNHDAPPGSPSAQSFRQIERQASRAAGLTRQLLTYARKRVIEPSTIDLNHLVGEATDFLRQLIGEQTHMALSLAPDLWAASADAGQIERVLMNLCVNARDAMPDGGELKIETRNARLQEGDPHLPSDCPPGRYVVLAVSDSGVGMDATTIEHIFDPFFTTKDVGKGTGLGLATVLGIVKQHHGFIEVKSQPNQGAQFRVFLPATDEMAEAKSAVVDTPVTGDGETVLVAEDHDGTLDMTCEALRSFGYRVLTARDGEETVRVFRENKDHVSLLLIDVVMPKLHGGEVYREICKCKPGVPVIFTSGHPEQYAELSDHDAEVLAKPYLPKLLVRKIRSVLDAASRQGPGARPTGG